VAVVGSFGKGAAARALSAALLGQPRLAQRSNFSTYLALALLRIPRAQRHAVIEVGVTGPDQMAAYARMLRPDIAVATSIGSEHLTSFKTLEATRQEKAEMVRALPESGLAVLNGDDPNTRWMASQTRARALTYGFGESNDVRATDVRIDWPHGTRFTLHANGQRRDMRIRLIGWPMVYGALAAAAVGLAEGLEWEAIASALEATPPQRGRLEPVLLANGSALLCDDYKAPIETVEAALDVLGQIPARRRLAVLGEIQERAGSQGPVYRRLGARAAQVAEKILFIGSKDSFHPLRAGAARAGLGREAVAYIHWDPLAAVQALREELRPGDVALIKSRLSQRLSRIRLALAGRAVRCNLKECLAKRVTCETCPMVEKGWDGRKPVM